MSTHRRITAEDLYHFTWIDMFHASVNGHIAYAARTVNKDRNGYISRIELISFHSEGGKSFTFGEHDTSPSWSPDGTRLAFLRKQDGQQQVWVMPADGGEARAVTGNEQTPHTFGVQAFAWSPDGLSLLYTAQVASHRDEAAHERNSDTSGPHSSDSRVIVIDRLKPKSDGSGLWNGRRNHLFAMTLDTGETTDLTPGEVDVTHFVWSPDSLASAFIAQSPAEPGKDPDALTTNDLYVVDHSSGTIRQLTHSRLGIIRATYAPDGSTLAFLAQDHNAFANAGLSRLYLIDATGGDEVCMSKSADLHLANTAVNDMRSGQPSPPIYHPDGQTIYVLASHEGSVQIVRFNLDGEMTIVAGGERDIYAFQLIHDGRQLIYAAADPSRPCDLFRLDLLTGEEVRLTTVNDNLLGDIRLSKPHSFWVTASDGQRLQGWIIPPADISEGNAETGKTFPAILEIHGGPHAMYAHSFNHEFQLLSAQGFAVVYSNPRGSHGYGQSFVNACRGDYGGKDYSDVLEVFDDAIRQYPYIDQARTGVTGGSYGGFMTNWIVGHTDRFQAAVTQRSISNWLSLYGTSDIGYHFTENEIKGTPWDQPELLWKHSPLAYVKQVNTPLLLLHGEEDLRCPIEQAEQFYTALKREGKVTQMVRFPGASHELSRSGKPILRLERLQRITGWFTRYLQTES